MFRKEKMQNVHQLEDKREARGSGRESSAEARQRKTIDGLAASFTSQEVKSLFFSYLTAMLLVEGLIFFFSFINHLATEGSVFPWKAYLFATFVTPVAITFVFGLILLTFNRLFYGRTADDLDEGRHVSVGSWHRGQRISTFLDLIHRLPLLFSMLLLIAATALAYKLEDLMVYTAQVGAITAKYLYFTVIGVMAAGAFGVAIWVFLSYRLKSKTLSADHQYRMKLMEQFGMVQLEDGTMLDKQGKVLFQHPSTKGHYLSSTVDDLPLIGEISDADDERDEDD